MQNEIWKDIPDYPWYQVSNKGRVRSFRQGERILRPAPDTYGYPIVVLCNKKGRKTRTIHRLVAIAFIPNPQNKPAVDHINTIRNDNRVENLRWVTNKENCNNQKSLEKYKAMKHIYEAVKKQYKPVYQILNGKIIEEYKCIREAERRTGIQHQSISAVLRGRCRVAGGFGWQYKK